MQTKKINLLFDMHCKLTYINLIIIYHFKPSYKLSEFGLVL